MSNQYPPFEHNTQPYNPVAYQPPKKKRHTLRNITIVVGSLFALLIVSAALSGGQQPSGAPASGAPAAVQTVDSGPTPVVTPTTKPVAPPTAAKTTAPQPAKPKVTKPAMTASQEQAIGTAEDYLNGQSFSRKGLIEQLVFEGFSTKDATFGVDHVTVNWNEQAALTAKQYLNGQHFSRSGLIEQLEYEGFTAKQAAYGVKKAGL